ncbi:MAG: VOC family protein [Minisyncoccota bacterium]
MKKMNPVAHFEMPYEDKECMTNFYAEAFGWHPHMLGPEMGSYIVVTTTKVNKKTRFPKEPGRINGGFYAKTEDPWTHHPSIVIAVDDIKAAMKKVAEAGGTVRDGRTPGEPDDIPGIGLYVSFIDTEGNRVSMLQPSPMMETRPK